MFDERTVYDSNVCISSGAFGFISKGIIYIDYQYIHCAIKHIVLSKGFTYQDACREVDIMMKIRHPNVLGCYGFYRSIIENTISIILPLMRNGDLQHWRSTVAMNDDHKIRALIDISRGMKYIHANDIVHRDLKLKNVLVGDDKHTMKICDFGTSKYVLDTRNTLCGTVVYIAPEQILSDPVVSPHKIDIYAFGILIWELWAGDVSYKDLQTKYKNKPLEFLNWIHRFPVVRPDIRHVRLITMGKTLLSLMVSCWDADPRLRPESFSDIVVECEFALTCYKQQCHDEMGALDFALKKSPSRSI